MISLLLLMAGLSLLTTPTFFAGQSGDVNDPHYRDLYELWSAGKYFPVFYTRKKVESVTQKVVQLSPPAKSLRK